ncbi:MAG TPA: hypothetical protein VKU60_06400 [Chloroflexota bacterium]|nr:hypothetical protein [Chloroflexota bacterium]
MPKTSGPSQAGDEAAQKLLEGASPASLSKEDLLAAVEALGSHKSAEAANVLAGLDQPKDVAKAARRALFRLQTQGVRPNQDPARPEPETQPKTAVAKITLLEGRISSYDPRGTRAVSILAEKPFTGLVNMFAIASDTEGLLDTELSTTTKKAFFARLENFNRQYSYIDFVPVPPDYANQVLYRCAELNDKAGRPLPQDFSMWKSFGVDRPDPPLEAPIFQELPVEEVRQRISLEDTAELAHTEFEAWAYDEEQLKEHLARLDTARGGPLVLSEGAQKGREQAIVDEATDAIFSDEELARAKERLQETAHLLFQHGHREAAERSLRAALSIGEGAPHIHPFLRELMAKSIELSLHPDHEHQHEHEHEHAAPATKRTESGIVLPA